MNFDKESKSEAFIWVGGGGGEGSGGKVGFRPKKKTTKNNNHKKQKKTIGIQLLFVLMPYIQFQVPSSRGSLVLTNKRSNGQVRGITLPTFTEFSQKSF